jgi:hypothetical protein
VSVRARSRSSWSGSTRTSDRTPWAEPKERASGLSELKGPTADTTCLSQGVVLTFRDQSRSISRAARRGGRARPGDNVAPQNLGAWRRALPYLTSRSGSGPPRRAQRRPGAEGSSSRLEHQTVLAVPDISAVEQVKGDRRNLKRLGFLRAGDRLAARCMQRRLAVVRHLLPRSFPDATRVEPEVFMGARIQAERIVSSFCSRCRDPSSRTA